MKHIDKVSWALLIASSALLYVAIFHFVNTTPHAKDVIQFQNDLTVNFLNTLKQKPLTEAIKSSLKSIFDFSLPLITFLVLTSVSLALLAYVKDKKLRYLVALIILPSFLALKSSVALWLVLAVAASVLLVSHKDLRKSVARGLLIINLVLAVFLFVHLNSNQQAYEPIIRESNQKLFSSFLPNATSIQDQQKQMMLDFIDRYNQGLKQSVETAYMSLDSQIRTSCKPVYDAMTQVVDAYANEVKASISKQQAPEQQLQQKLEEMLPFIKVTYKIFPLTTALAFYTLAEVIRNILSFIYLLVSFLLPKELKP